ncbi:hypothetical protein C8J56DRAFT_1175015 [Mycena floridula]|nr:hypothetical protein C8J56DRAFT_1175015 [Mycena floridula]
MSKTHGFFFALGGFVSHGGYTTLSQIRGESDIALAYLRDISSVNEEDIKDKSKGDALSKGLALLQVLWFIAQCIARQIQRLPNTTLEIATIAFAALNIFIWILWWNKPLGVERPLIIGPHDIREMFGVSLAGEYGSYQPEKSTSVPLFWCSSAESKIQYEDQPRPIIFMEFVVGFIFGAIHCLGWNAESPSFVEAIMWKAAVGFITAYVVAWAFIFGAACIDWSGSAISWRAFVCHRKTVSSHFATLFLAQSSEDWYMTKKPCDYKSVTSSSRVSSSMIARNTIRGFVRLLRSIIYKYTLASYRAILHIFSKLRARFSALAESTPSAESLATELNTDLFTENGSAVSLALSLDPANVIAIQPAAPVSQSTNSGPTIPSLAATMVHPVPGNQGGERPTPMWPSQTKRYEKQGKLSKTRTNIRIPGNTRNYCQSEQTPVDQWASCLHPGGNRYNRHVEMAVLVDDLPNDSSAVNQIALFARDSFDTLTRSQNVELVIDLWESGLHYYFVDHGDRNIFWLDDVDLLGAYRLPGVTNISELKYAVETEYWYSLVRTVIVSWAGSIRTQESL